MVVYSERENTEVKRLVNDTGVALAQYELAVVAGYVAIALEAVASGATGPFYVAEGADVQVSTLKAGEDTFATLGQPVYLDTVTDTLSDTSTPGYYEVGSVSTIKNANGVVWFDKYRRAVLIP